MRSHQKAILGGCFVLGLLFYSYYNFDFVNSLHVLIMKQQIVRFLGKGDNIEEVHSAPDIFEYCPFEPADPWPQEIWAYINDKFGFNETCKPNKHLQPITVLRNRRVSISDNHKNAKDIDCQARCISYISDCVYSISKWRKINSSSFDCDFVDTKCTSEMFSKTNGTNRFVHMQIVEQKPDIKIKNSGMLDVHLFIIDSVGSSQFIRALPRTTNFLVHGMEAIQFRKFNKVGYNSKPNGFPALFGKTTEDVGRMVMNLPTMKKDLSYAEACMACLDNHSYIPIEYMRKGYKTLSAEDYHVASFLNYPSCCGMKTRPYNHIFRPLSLLTSKNEVLKHILEDGNCRTSLNYMLDYLSLFLKAYKDIPKFSFSWAVNLAHDHAKGLYQGDYSLYSFFRSNRKALEKSFLFIFGDHGPRWGEEVKTEEENNPFLFVVLPKSLRHTKIHEQVSKNSKELMTPHDLHATFKDILYYQPQSSFSETEFKEFKNNPRGSSLLRELRYNMRRTCKTLPIPFKYCICQYQRKIVRDQPLIQKLGRFAAEQINEKLRSYKSQRKCHQVTLGNVEKAEQFVLPGNHSIKFDAEVYNVTFTVAAPARGKFNILLRIEKGHIMLGEENFHRLDEARGNCTLSLHSRSLCTCK